MHLPVFELRRSTPLARTNMRRTFPLTVLQGQGLCRRCIGIEIGGRNSSTCRVIREFLAAEA